MNLRLLLLDLVDAKRSAFVLLVFALSLVAGAVAAAPTVSITSPTAGALFIAPATITIDATATDSGSLVTNVQFLINGSLISNSTITPFTATAANLTNGAYMLTAIAADANGFLATNSIQVLVTPRVTLWTGPAITFNNAAGSNPALPASQDRVTSNVWITRGPTMGIFNAAQETNFTSAVSPAGTQWAYGSLSNYASLTFTNWNTWARTFGNSPTTTVGQPAVLHLVADNIYLSITFTTWGMTSSQFAYVRSTPPGIAGVSNILLSSASALDGQFRFVVSGLTPGTTNYIQASSDPSFAGNWVSIATNVAGATNLNIAGIATTNAPFLFFRLLENQ